MRALAAVGDQPQTRHWVIAALLLAFACSDGAATAIQVTRGWTSPYPLMVPLVLAAIALLIADTGRIPARLVVGGLALGLFAIMSLLFQLTVAVALNLAGLGQFWIVFLCLFAVQDLVRHAPAAQMEALRRGVLILHYGTVAYLVVTIAIWYAFRFDISVYPIVSGVQPVVRDYYGFRPSGVSREAAWAAFLLMATFMAVATTSPRDRVRAYVAFVVGTVILASATALAFVVLAGLMLAIDRGQLRRIPVLVIASAPALALLGWVLQDRILRILSGNDPSGRMRRDSALVAWDVIQRSFPEGTGYGNFRAFAYYGSQFSNYINLATISYYKSDIPVLNLLAEFGLFALVIVGALMLLFARGARLLFWGYLAFILLLGSLLLPANLVVIVAIGIAERERRSQPVRVPVPVPSDSRGLVAQHQGT